MKARDSSWARAAATGLTRAGVSPNLISAAGVAFASLGGAALIVAARANIGRGWAALLFVTAALAFQARLVCNMLDGMVAIEGGRAGACGDLVNDLPDRASDILALGAAGLALPWSWGPWLGAFAALTAVMVAYTRVLATSIGARPNYGGPMAKQRRMTVLSVGVVAEAGEALVGRPGWALAGALAVVALGSLVTCAVRTASTAEELRGVSR